jgi:methionine aminopeptidase
MVCIDITVYLDGYHGDTAQTFLVGTVVCIPFFFVSNDRLKKSQDEPGKELAKVTNAALDAGIGACGPGRPFSEIGRAIHDIIRDTSFCVSPHFTGHGIGTTFHRKPWVIHDRTRFVDSLNHIKLENSQRRTGDNETRTLFYHRGTCLARRYTYDFDTSFSAALYN